MELAGTSPGIARQDKSLRSLALTVATSFALLATLAAIIVMSSIILPPTGNAAVLGPVATSTPSPTPTPFDPNVGAALPNNRIVAFYGIPGAPVAGPAYAPTSAMLTQLQAQAAVYATLDPSHPVLLGLDLVVNVADGFPGPNGTYDHDVDAATVQSYITFCQQNNVLLFLDLELGRAQIRNVLPTYLPYLEQYSFVHLALDPEWAFPAHSGIPGYNVGFMEPGDINWVIDQLAAIPMQYHVPRKVLILHQFRDIVLPNKSQIDKTSPDVSVVLHVDSVGNYNGGVVDKKMQYQQWVQQQWTNLGGFKLFYKLEAPYHLMTPQEVLAMQPPPLVITYGN